MPLKLSVVTAERTVLEREDEQRLIVPTTEGQITLLPSHAALMASLDIGEMIAVVDGRQDPIVVHGGFIQVLRDEVSVLADAAEHVDEIDETRAEAARQRAQERIEGRVTTDLAIDIGRARRSLLRAQARIRARRRHGRGVPAAQA